MFKVTGQRMTYGCEEVVQLSSAGSVLLHGLLEDPLIVSPVRHQLWVPIRLVMHATEVREEQNSHPKVNETVANLRTGRGECTEHVCVLWGIKVESSKRWFPGSCDSQCRKSFLASTVKWISDTLCISEILRTYSSKGSTVVAVCSSPCRFS